VSIIQGGLGFRAQNDQTQGIVSPTDVIEEKASGVIHLVPVSVLIQSAL
jgi:hypothetical protein